MKRQLALATPITDPITGLVCDKLRIHFLGNPFGDTFGVGWEPFNSSTGQACVGGDVNYLNSQISVATSGAAGESLTDKLVDFILLDMDEKVTNDVDLSGTLEDME